MSTSVSDSKTTWTHSLHLCSFDIEVVVWGASVFKEEMRAMTNSSLNTVLWETLVEHEDEEKEEEEDRLTLLSVVNHDPLQRALMSAGDPLDEVVTAE